MKATIEAVSADPLRRAELRPGIRYWPLNGFAYVVLYRVKPKSVYFTRVIHTSRSDEHWFDRDG